MGVVYRARHRETGATVAIKTVEAQAADILSNIRREIHALRRASHPGLIEVLDHGKHIVFRGNVKVRFTPPEDDGAATADANAAVPAPAAETPVIQEPGSNGPT